ncbi:hypothetical protein V2J09_010605 [Rumex salicifolius]
MRVQMGRNPFRIRPNVLRVFVILGFLSQIRCQHDAAKAANALYNEQGNNQAVGQNMTQYWYNHMFDFTGVFGPEIKKHLGFCITDVDKEWNKAFNFSSDLEFMQNCKKQQNDYKKRLCTAAEVKFYFTNFFGPGSKNANYLKPNKNCNLSSWVDGCEPGWACSAGMNKVKMNDRENIPTRTETCRPCCEGFFCPKGITCMIPCPLGAYCPMAKLNSTTGTCTPYVYQIPPDMPNHTCGGADIWSDVTNGPELFCSPGSYCPSTIKKINCSEGRFCRLGSTKESRCFKLANCKANSVNQNITAYGLLLVIVVTMALLIVYNCSDHVLTTREKRLARSRERAIRSARETAQARERWKSAKDGARKRAVGLQEQLSRTFSKRKSVSNNMIGGTSSSDSKAKKKESGLKKMMLEIEDNPDGNVGFNLDIGDKHIKKQAPKAKELHTKSQIFKYAYGQLEKEKAMQEENKNLTFSGVISMAQDTEVNKRPLLEVAFKDLTLTLKGKNKHLMRSVSGKIMPGRVSAVMGPSGAGKTTFLSALSGKITGCNVSGEILINGKNESIHSYKRIIGFVPQDDIVHGDLTVEENLVFSARCRLPAEMPKAERVLVIERVIESLGLQAIRDSVVGTVEKRGISGGQRKRVNVGLEMVMEPSLLILDEPTSGLDSSSSLLLLRALRREALEGVNVCMVIHQPSYSLFKMFDDLILLAKGGLTVYHGSVKKLEEYFSGLGIHVPDRVNPPDHYIDILEGITKTNANVTREQLPVRWMLHNGYAVPSDMLHLCDQASSSPSASAHGSDKAIENSFVGDLLQDMKSNARQKCDAVMHNFLNEVDLSERVTPGLLRQYRYYLGRVLKQRLREAKSQAVDYLILLLAGVCLGTLAKVSDESFGSLALLCKIAALRSFSLDKLEYWRESAAGMSSLAYFLAKDTTDMLNTFIKPLVYLSMFYFFNNPRSSFGDNYIILVCLVYCVTGIGYALAIYLEPGPAQLWSVLLPVVLTLIANQEKGSGMAYQIGKVTYPKWALEAFVISNAEMYYGVWLVTRCGSLMVYGYDQKNWSYCLMCLLLAGFASRLVAFFLMVTFQKK